MMNSNGIVIHICVRKRGSDMKFEKMSERFHKETKPYIRILYILFFIILLLALFSVAFEWNGFDVLFDIGKYAWNITALILILRMCRFFAKVLKQHDELVDKLAEKEDGMEK